MLELNLCLLLLAIAGSSIGDDEISSVMKKLEIIPDVIDIPPKEFLKVTYPGNVMVNKGNELTPTQVRYEPILEWTADENFYYTILMTAPDAPNRENPYWREFIHWLVVNIPGNDVEQGEIMCPYIGAAVLKTSGLTRFVFLVFKQTEYMVFDEAPLNNTSTAGHTNFNTKKFAIKYGMGDAIAGNAFQARYDEYVPILLKQLNLENVMGER